MSNTKVSDKIKRLKINKKLPQIILPANKIGMFLDWYNEDLRSQDHIPKAFSEGYLTIENDIIQIDISKCSDYIRKTAKELNTTYRVIENRFKYFLDSLKQVTLYFEFIDRKIFVYVYGTDGSIISKINFEMAQGVDELTVERYVTDVYTWEEIQDKFNYYCIILLTASLWYIATTTKTTKYYYEEKQPVIKYKDKEIKSVSRTKTISTPIYDMTKIRKVKVEHLIKRRKGWTYSHAFQVHGHYRHYKDGKVVFINSYIKGKDKKLQNQVITLSPKE